MSKLVVIEPNLLIYEYTIEYEKTKYSDELLILSFLESLNELLSIVSEFSTKILSSNYVYTQILSKFPSIPCTEMNISNNQIRSLLADIRKKIKRVIYCSKSMDDSLGCSLNDEIVTSLLSEKTYYNEYLELFIMKCKKHSNIEIGNLIKSHKDTYFNGDIFKIRCDENCGDLFEMNIKCHSLYEYKNYLMTNKVNEYREIDDMASFKKIITYNYESNSSFKSFKLSSSLVSVDEKTKPFELEFTSFFKKTVNELCEPSIWPLLIDSITKKVYSIHDSGLRDETFKTFRRFRVNDFWRVHYSIQNNVITLIEFGIHDIGIKKE